MCYEYLYNIVECDYQCNDSSLNEYNDRFNTFCTETKKGENNSETKKGIPWDEPVASVRNKIAWQECMCYLRRSTVVSRATAYPPEYPRFHYYY